MLRVELFGGLRLVGGSRVVTQFLTPKTGELLGLLSVESDRLHSREKLLETFWEAEPVEHARMSLGVAITHLRSALEPPGTERGAVLVTERLSVMLSSSLIAIDTAEFAARVEEACCSLCRSRRLFLLSTAVEQYRPEILSGYGGEWILPAQARLNDLYARAVPRLAQDLETEGQWDEALRMLRFAIEIDPLRDAFHRRLIALYALMGNARSAVRQYERMADIWRTELDSEPSPADQKLIGAIRDGFVPGGAGLVYPQLNV